MPDTFDAEYVALTQLHANALITLDQQLAGAAKDLVTIAPIEALYWTQAGLASGTATRTYSSAEMSAVRVVVAWLIPRQRCGPGKSWFW